MYAHTENITRIFAQKPHRRAFAHVVGCESGRSWGGSVLCCVHCCRMSVWALNGSACRVVLDERARVCTIERELPEHQRVCVTHKNGRSGWKVHDALRERDDNPR